MDSDGTQYNHKARQVSGPRAGQSFCVKALLTSLLILFQFLNINTEALLSSKGRVAQISRMAVLPTPARLLAGPWIPRAHVGKSSHQGQAGTQVGRAGQVVMTTKT